MGDCGHVARINTTDVPRTGVVSGYAVGWLRQEENQYLSCPPKDAAKLPKRAQQILGYRTTPPSWAAPATATQTSSWARENPTSTPRVTRTRTCRTCEGHGRLANTQIPP